MNENEQNLTNEATNVNSENVNSETKSVKTESKELISVKSVSDLVELREQLEQSKKKRDNANTEFASIPTEGRFARIGVKEFTLKDDDGKETTVKSLGLFTENGEFISENNLTKQHLGEVLTSVKTGKRKGKFILKSDRLTNLNKFGSTLNSQMLKIVGKSFTTVKKDVRNYQQQFLTTETFDEVCQQDNSDASLKDALNKTEIVNGYIFKIV